MPEEEFFGRAARRDGNSYVLGGTQDYIDDILRTVCMHNCTGSTTPGTSAVKQHGGAPLLQTEDVNH